MKQRDVWVSSHKRVFGVFSHPLGRMGVALLLGMFLLSLSFTHLACDAPSSQEKTTETIPEGGSESVVGEVSQEAATEPANEVVVEEKTTETQSEGMPENTAESTKEADASENTPPEATTESIAETTAEATTETTAEATTEVITESTTESTAEATAEATTEATPDAVARSFTLTGFVTNFFAPNRPPLAGVKVCLHQRPSVPCAFTGQDGRYSLASVPYDTDIAVTFEDASQDLMPMMFPTYVDFQSFSRGIPSMRAEMFTKTVATQFGALLGISNLDLNNKTLVLAELQELDPFLKPVVGGTVVMTPTSGTGPIYLPNAGQSSASSTQDAGIAIFANVDPNQDYRFVFSHPQRTCYPDDRTRRNANNESVITAYAGWAIVTSWLCDTLPPTP